MSQQPAIRCIHDAAWPVDSFKPNPRNPKVHPLAQLEVMAQVIRIAGWRSPIIVSKRSGYVVKGHGRLAAAKFAGFTHCPVQQQDYETAELETADMVADNQIAELSERDDAGVAAILKELGMESTDAIAAGFTKDAISELLASAAEDAAGTRRKVGGQIIQYNLIFEDEEQRQEWLSFLKQLKTRYPDIPTPGARLIAFTTSSTSSTTKEAS